jgi:hypothetical protein
MLRRLTPRLNRKIALDAFRLFVERHAPVLRALPVWTLRSVAPPHLPGIAEPLNSRNLPVTIEESRGGAVCRCGVTADPKRPTGPPPFGRHAGEDAQAYARKLRRRYHGVAGADVP